MLQQFRSLRVHVSPVIKKPHECDFLQTPTFPGTSALLCWINWERAIELGDLIQMFSSSEALADDISCAKSKWPPHWEKCCSVRQLITVRQSRGGVLLAWKRFGGGCGICRQEHRSSLKPKKRSLIEDGILTEEKNEWEVEWYEGTKRRDRKMKWLFGLASNPRLPWQPHLSGLCGNGWILLQPDAGPRRRRGRMRG